MRNVTMCTICDSKVEQKKSIDFNFEVMCKYCGNYHIDRRLDITFLEDNNINPRISSWVREQNSFGIYPKLIMDDYDNLMSITDKQVSQKYEMCVSFFAREQYYEIDSDGGNTLCRILFWCEDEHELSLLLNKAVDSKHLRKNDGMYHITYDGKLFVEELGKDNKSNKIFMAFHFTDEMKEQFETTIRRAVIDASENRLEAVRVSSSTTDHDTKIDDELIGMLKSSKAVIADFTGQRNAVYYEAGYAMGLGIPVIWTCKETDADTLSFDTRQYPHIIWKDEEDLYTQVVNRLKAKIL